ncbi:MAG: sensor histidine kinase [Clostridia bacterium]
MVYKLIDLLFCLVGAYLYTEAIETIERDSLKKERRVILILIFGSLNFLLRQFLLDSNQFLRIIITYFIFVAISVIAYKKLDFRVIFPVVTVYGFIVLISKLIMIYIYKFVGLTSSEMIGTTDYLMLYNGNIILLMIFFIGVLKSFYRKRYSVIIEPISSWTKYILIGTIAIIVNIQIIITYYQTKQRVDKVLWIVPLSLIAFLLLAIYSQLLLRAQKEHNEQVDFYIRNITEMADEIQSFKHDINNVLVSLYGLAENDQLHKLKKRVLELQDLSLDEYVSNTEAFLNIKDNGLTNLLAEKMYKAHKKNINFSIDAPYKIEKLPINGVDFLRILGVLIDNAIEAAEYSDKKSVKCVLISSKLFFDVSIINSIKDKPDLIKIQQRGYTTKENNKGLGLTNVERMLGKYSKVEWNTVIENKWFMQNLTFTED